METSNNQQEVLSRGEFFRQEHPFRFGIDPIESLDQLADVSIRIQPVRGLAGTSELVLTVMDKTRRQIARVWLSMGTQEELEAILHGPKIASLASRWLSWLDYAHKVYPVEGGHLYYRTEWEPVTKPHRWLESDPDLYGFSSKMSYELLINLQHYTSRPEDAEMLFRRNMDIHCSYPGASRNESLFESMAMKLSFYDHERIDLIGLMWFRDSEEASQLVIHSFDTIEHCKLWLDRHTVTTEECCSRMADLAVQ